MCIYTLVLFPFFLHVYDYAVIYSGYREASDYVGRFNPGDA